MMTSPEVQVKSPCGAADLVAALFGKDPNEVRRRLGLPEISKKEILLVSCSQCGCLFERYVSEVLKGVRLGYQHTFCSRVCGGEWRRKHDHDDLVWQKHLETGWGAVRLSRLLGIPSRSVTQILAKKRKELKAEGGEG